MTEWREMDENGWPKDGSTHSFSVLADAVYDAVRFAYKVQRRNKGASIPWTGPERTPPDLACAFPFKDQLSAEQLEYSDKEQGRDALRELVGVAVALGIEQGRRAHRESAEFQMLKSKLDLLRVILKEPSNG